ncbi:flagellar hook-basal body complex protein [Thalassoglobus sp. JC818]|uniref:flagellar hook protein FlgE n=1 Tax=Thalassoglobus sp. JC818 TaxID=3232136 RepID=UPI00345A7C01
MANALITGVSGLATHQKMIEVVGNNLANLNTTGFKARRTHFSDVFHETVKGGSGGAVGVVGGSNPAQVGNGSKLSTIGVNFTQGNLEGTGATYDFAIDGEGFFMVDSGQGPLFTRAGVFHVDQDGYLVDSATGYHVQRFSSVGEPDGVDPGFQIPGDDSIRIPLGTTVAGAITQSAAVEGNLAPGTRPAISQVLQSGQPLLAGGTAVSAATLWNDLDITSTPFQPGDALSFQGTDHDGTAVNSSFSIDGTTTVGDVINAMSNAYSGATASLNADGSISLIANESGQSDLSVVLAEEPGNVGGIDLTSHQFGVNELGQDGEVVRTGLEIFDERGDGHLIGLEFEKQSDGTWTMTAALDPSVGVLSDDRIEGLTFREDGSFDGIAGPDGQIEVQFVGQASSQPVIFEFGTPGTLNGLTSLSGESSVASTQDGFSTGTLVGVTVDGSGLIEGIGSNGRRMEIAQIALATFRNPNGLSSEGNNFFAQTLSSGNADVGSPFSGGRGRINAGQLEASNVDIAVEFTRLIVAQRGFSANARTITVTDEILEELNNIIR